MSFLSCKDNIHTVKLSTVSQDSCLFQQVHLTSLQLSKCTHVITQFVCPIHHNLSSSSSQTCCDHSLSLPKLFDFQVNQMHLQHLGDETEDKEKLMLSGRREAAAHFSTIVIIIL